MSPPALTSVAATVAFASLVMVSLAVGRERLKPPPPPPSTRAIDRPSPDGGLMVRSETPPGPSSSWLPAGALLRSMCNSCVPELGDRSMPARPKVWTPERPVALTLRAVPGTDGSATENDAPLLLSTT